MTKTLLLAFFLGSVLSMNSFSNDEIDEAADLQTGRGEIFHEMFLACVASKTECKTLAREEGFAYLKAVRDSGRCVERSRPLACIVKH